MDQKSISATLIRGGTSKGVFFLQSNLPKGKERREELLLRSFGSPDPKQVDGVGGSHSTASKAMFVSVSDEPGVDVEYLFAQVGIEKPVVDWGGNCGNLTFGVGPFALERGIIDVDGTENEAQFVLKNANTSAIVEQAVPVDENGFPRYRGELQDAGLPTSGARIRSRFLDPAGSVTGDLFPTGHRKENLRVEDVGTIEVSLVDVTNPCVFVRAEDVGLQGTETPEQIDADGRRLATLERIRSAACERLGFVEDAALATQQSPGIPKLAIVGERADYETTDGERMRTTEFDILGRIMSMQKAHHAYAVTGAMCTAVAASMRSTIPSEFLDLADPTEVVIGHPKGTMRVGLGLRGESVEFASLDRTARQLMHGDLFYLPDSCVS